MQKRRVHKDETILEEGSVQPKGGVRERLLRGNIAFKNNIIWLFLF